jgi:adenylate kinase family enzyme
MTGKDSFPIGQRIVVIGTTCTGKTTLAARLSHRLGVPHIELDALHWEPKWCEASLDVFRARVAQALTAESWIVDGNYGKVRDLVWGCAETIIWLDYPLPVILGRLAKRTLRRALTQEELWNGNHETLRGGFFSRDSLFVWALKTYQRGRRENPVLFASPEYRHLAVIRLSSPRAAERWLAGI